MRVNPERDGGTVARMKSEADERGLHTYVGMLLSIGAAEIERLREEVRVLRSYGNKDCTAMADEALELKRTTGKGPWED